MSDAVPEQPSSAADGGVGEFIPEFLEESLDCLAQAESALLALEAGAAAPDAVDVALRAFHTIKGTAAFLGLDAISALAHDAESRLVPVRDGTASFQRKHADALLKAADRMRGLLHELRGAAAPAQRPAAAPGDARVIAPAPAASRPAAAASAVREEWARVRTRRLDQLVDLVGELVVAHAMVAQDPLVMRERHGPLATKVQHTSRIVRELQALGIGLRMVPLRPLFQRLQRLVRDLARQSDKQVELITSGEETELDRTMVEALADPLVHMIRNAVDHAIEPVAERVARDKPPAGALRLSARHGDGSVLVELHDDGRGLDRALIVRRAVERGVVGPEQELTDAEIDALIFAPGLSTAGAVTELSGRGVGMDVVKRNVEALRGRIDIASQPGAGTTFTLRLPLTLAVTDGLLVRVGRERYILPTLDVVTSFRPTAAAIVRAARGGEIVMVDDRPLPVVRLHHVFGIDDAVTDPAAGVLVVIAEGAEHYALLVDELLGQQQFVARPLASGLGAVAGLAGSAVLGDGRVGLIVEPAGLLAAARRTLVRTPAASAH